MTKAGRTGDLFTWKKNIQQIFMYATPHLTLLKPKIFNHPCEYLILLQVPSSGGDAEISLWHVVPLQVGQSSAEQHRSKGAQNTLHSGHLGELWAWMTSIFDPASGGLGIVESGTGVSGSTDSENEVMALGLERSPLTLLGPEAPSHLCAVWPSGRQLLPLIISPNGWICFPLTSSSLHNNIPPWLHPDTPSSRHRPPFLPRLKGWTGTTWPAVETRVVLLIEVHKLQYHSLVCISKTLAGY